MFFLIALWLCYLYTDGVFTLLYVSTDMSSRYPFPATKVIFHIISVHLVLLIDALYKYENLYIPPIGITNSSFSFWS